MAPCERSLPSQNYNPFAFGAHSALRKCFHPSRIISFREILKNTLFYSSELKLQADIEKKENISGLGESLSIFGEMEQIVKTGFL